MNKYKVTVIDAIDRIVIKDTLFDCKEEADIEYNIWCDRYPDWLIVKLTEMEAQE